MLGKKNINIQKLLLIKGFDYISICFLGTEIYFKVFFGGGQIQNGGTGRRKAKRHGKGRLKRIVFATPQNFYYILKECSFVSDFESLPILYQFVELYNGPTFLGSSISS